MIRNFVQFPTRAFLFLQLATFCLLMTSSVLALDKTSTGFFYPTGSGTWPATGGNWMSRDAAHGGGYTSGYYHIAQDMVKPEGSNVYAISDGDVVKIYTTNSTDDYGIGTGNSVIFVKHTLQNGNQFLAEYMHVRPVVHEGDHVYGGNTIASIGPYQYDVPHLHFGIHPSLSVPTTSWGRMANSAWSGTNGFVDPVNWIQTQSPSGSNSAAGGTNPSPADIRAKLVAAGQKWHIPPHILFGMAWQESSWRQFDDNGNTVVSPDGGIGIMQLTGATASQFDVNRLKTDIDYNIDSGAKVLIDKWNITPYIGDNDRAKLENWYYAIWYYNSGGTLNNPNFNSNPYQHRVISIIANCPNGQWQNCQVSEPPASSISNPPGNIPTPTPIHVDANYDGIIDGDGGGGDPHPVPYLTVSESDTATTEGQAGFFRHGTPRYWNDATDSGDGGHMLWTYTGGSNLDNIGDWRPNLPDTRNYEVFVYIPRLHATTHLAHYEIYGADGTTNKTVDQYAYSDVWVSLGTYKFNAGTSGWLRLVDGYNEPYDGKTKVGFDTAKWEARDAPDTTPPTVTITSGHANGGVYAGPQRVTWRIDDKGGSGIERWGQAWDTDPGANPYTADSGDLDLPLGTHTLNVHVRDKTGNEKNWTFGPFTLVIDVGRGSGGNVDQRYIDCYNRVGAAILGSVIQDGGNYVHAANGTFGNGGAQDLAGGSGGHNIIMARDGAALAYSVRGNIWNKYSGMGFGTSPLGFPTSDEQDATPSSQGTVGRVNHFDDGVITSAAPGTFEVHGNIFHKYANLAGSGGVLGFEVSENVAVPATDSRRAGNLIFFEGGMIDDSSLGTFELHGNVYAKDYGMARLLVGVLNSTGHLTGDMQNAAASPFGTIGQVCHFEHGDLYATAAYKAHFVSGAILGKYQAAGASGGHYGFPISDVYPGNGGQKQDFEGGTLNAGASSEASPVSHVLWNNQDGRASIWNYDAGAGSFTQNSYGPFAGWTAAAIADGPDGKTRVLWNNSSGAASVWSLDNTAASSAHFEFGPFSGWTAKSLSVSAGNTTHLLWANTNGAASVWNYSAADGGYTHREYGPFAGWTPKAVADGPDARTRLLWTNANGQMWLWSLDNVTGTFTQNTFGPYAGWTAGMLSVGKDSTTHIAWTNADGRVSVWNYALGSAGFAQLTYGAFAGWAAQGLADSADGTACVLWDNVNGSASLWGLDNGTGAYTHHEFGPYAGWTAMAVSAGP